MTYTVDILQMSAGINNSNVLLEYIDILFI
jgi:hypothetical protein